MSPLCTRCGSEVGGAARFCSSCGAPVAPPSGAELKLATMVFADLVGSTELAAGRDPEELRGRLAPFFELAKATLEEHGGTVEKYIGDAVMAAFGVPTTHGDDPDRAIAAGLALVARIAEAGDGMAVRIGVETGDVLALEPGGDLSVTGQAVNAAARLQAAAAPNEVLVGERTARACRAARLEAATAVEAKGFPGPLRAWRAVSVRSDRPQAETPFLGRDDDLELLRLVYRRAVRERVPELVTITGDAGIGKTRLATELFDALDCDEPSPHVLVGRNPPYGRGIAFWALAEILRAVAGGSADDSVSAVREALRERLEELGADDAEEVAGALGAALGGADGGGDAEDELRRAWRRLVALLATERPLVIALDDAHWADDSLLDLVEEIAFRLEDAPVLLLCTARPELLERRTDFGRAARNTTQIELRPLAVDATEALATALLPERSPELARRVAQASGGNPFFTEEVVRSVIDEGGATDLPDTVQTAISARLDLLPAEEKRALQHAAVLGQSFVEDQLAELLGEDPAVPLAALAQKALVQERLATEPGRFGFRHQLIRDVAYASVPRADRAVMHEHAAECVVGLGGERYPELAELVAFHRIQAAELAPSPERSAAALAATLDAAEAVFGRGAGARAQELYEQAADLADAPADRIAALRAGAAVASRRFRGDEGVRLLRVMAEVAQEAGDPGAAAEAYARAVELLTRMSGITGVLPEREVADLLRRGTELVDAADPATKTRLVLDEAWMAWRFDRTDDMEEPARRGLEMARALGDPILLSSALDAASACAWHAGRQTEALEQNRERLQLLDTIGAEDASAESERSDALHMMVETLVQVGRLREARSYAARARQGDLDRGIVYSGWARSMLPAFYLGEWDDVLAMAQRVRDAWTALERPPSTFMAGAVATAGAVLGYRGDERGCEDWMGFAEEITGERGAQMVGIRMFRADVALHHGRIDDALEALETAGPFFFWWSGPYYGTLAEALVEAGDERAADAVRTAKDGAGQNPLSQGLALRAEARLANDEAALREALALFERIECPYQAARTGWLLGGDDRKAAAEVFARLGATEPG